MEQLLATNLNIPQPHPNIITRQRLVEKLNAGHNCKLTLISAPAGFGKTTILSAWTQVNNIPTAWVSLDVENNDQLNFLIYVIAALQKILPEVGNTSLAMLRSTPTSPAKNALIALINELTGYSETICLILDDYHLIDSEEVHRALTYLIDHIPTTMHIVVASRTDPPIPLSQLRARGQLLELRQSDLSFTFDEVAAFLNQKEQLNLTTEQISELEIRTEGWIAGLQLAAISLREKQDVTTFIQEFSGSHRFVIDYLFDEVLTNLPEKLRQFLIQTATLDRFTAALCDELTGRNDSAIVFKEIEAENLFLIPLDDRREWYRYHQLFRDYLVSELGDEQKAHLCKRAAEWFKAQGIYYECVSYLLAAGEIEQASQMMSQTIPELFNQGYLATITGWLETLPNEIVSGNEVLAIYKGYILFFTNKFDDARNYTKDAQLLLSLQTPTSIQGRLLCLQANLALSEGKLDDCIHFSREALEYLDEEDSSFRNLTYNVLGQVLELKAEITSAVDIYQQALNSGWQKENPAGALLIFVNLIFSLNELGKRKEALTLCDQLATESVKHDLPLMDALYLPWSQLSFEANELSLAQNQAQRALELLSSINFTQGILWAQYILAQIHLARHEYDALYKLTQAGYYLAPHSGREAPQDSWFAALEAQANLQQGEIIKCEYWAEAANFSPTDTPTYRLEYPYIIYVRLLMEQNRLDDAEVLLNTIEASARQGTRNRKLISISLLKAKLCMAKDKKEDALECVRQALRLAAPENYHRAFLDEGPKITRLLSQFRDSSPTFVNEILAASDTCEGHLIIGVPDALSEREVEVLQLVAQGFSNSEVADQLFVTVGTIKKHLNNIYSKLHVKSRTQAILRGKELGLLE